MDRCRIHRGCVNLSINLASVHNHPHTHPSMHISPTRPDPIRPVSLTLFIFPHRHLSCTQPMSLSLSVLQSLYSFIHPFPCPSLFQYKPLIYLPTSVPCPFLHSPFNPSIHLALHFHIHFFFFHPFIHPHIVVQATKFKIHLLLWSAAEAPRVHIS